jgi:fluoride exporter
MIKNILLVGLGGAAGSMLRFAVQRYANVPGIPYGTLIVNLTGCFLIGILWGLLSKNFITQATGILLMTGFCGGFTTFSAFTYEGVQMMQDNRWLLLAGYIGASIIGGLFATFAGYKLTS